MLPWKNRPDCRLLLLLGVLNTADSLFFTRSSHAMSLKVSQRRTFEIASARIFAGRRPSCHSTNSIKELEGRLDTE